METSAADSDTVRRAKQPLSRRHGIGRVEEAYSADGGVFDGGWGDTEMGKCADSGGQEALAAGFVDGRAAGFRNDDGQAFARGGNGRCQAGRTGSNYKKIRRLQWGGRVRHSGLDELTTEVAQVQSRRPVPWRRGCCRCRVCRDGPSGSPPILQARTPRTGCRLRAGSSRKEREHREEG